MATRSARSALASTRTSPTTRTWTASTRRTPARQTLSTRAYDVIASPASVGTSLYDAANVTFFGERDDIAMAFADSGTTTSETPGDPNTSVATAQPVTLAPLAVPNTLLDRPGHRR